jgi:SAM-dependent methyltransferase
VIDFKRGTSVKSCCAGFYELPIVSMLLGDNLHPGGPALTRKLAGAAAIGRNTKVLDVACGRGESDRVLAAHCGCQVVGVDYSTVNIARAGELTQDANLDGRVRFLAGDAERLPLDDESVDVVIAECSLCTFPDMTLALAEARRVLRPGGRVGISDVVLNAPVPESLHDLIGHVLCITGARSTQGYRQALQDAGFAAIRTRDVGYVLTEMLTRIERRMDTLGDLVESEQFAKVEGLHDAGPKLAEARDFVASGGIGYALFTGRNPRTESARHT